MVSVLPGSGRIYCETFNRVVHSVRAASQQAEKMHFAAKPEIWIGERRYRNPRSNRNTKGLMEEEVVWGYSLVVTSWWNTTKCFRTCQTFVEFSTSSTTCTALLLNEHNTSVPPPRHRINLECSERSLQNVLSGFHMTIYKSHVYLQPPSVKTQYICSLMWEKISRVNYLPKNSLLKVGIFKRAALSHQAFSWLFFSFALQSFSALNGIPWNTSVGSMPCKQHCNINLQFSLAWTLKGCFDVYDCAQITELHWKTVSLSKVQINLCFAEIVQRLPVVLYAVSVAANHRL